MTQLKIISFDTSSNRVNDFFAFAEDHYRDDPYWIGENQIFLETNHHQLFLLYDNQAIVGRAAAIINPQVHHQQKKTGLIGFYECIDHDDAASILFDAAKIWLQQQGCEFVLGPMDGSPFHRYRLVEPNEEKPFYLDIYHKPWYWKQFLDNGFEPVNWFKSTRSNPNDYEKLRGDRFTRYFEKRGYILRPLDQSNLAQDVKIFYDIINLSFAENKRYIPLPYKYFAQIWEPILKKIDPSFMVFCEDSDKQPIGYILGIDNHFEKEKKSGIVKSIAVRPGHKYRGIVTCFAENLCQRAKDRGYTEIIYSTLATKDNQAVNILSEHAEVIRRYALMGQAI